MFVLISQLIVFIPNLEIGNCDNVFFFFLVGSALKYTLFIWIGRRRQSIS